uniref:Uncharacterized protein n=1 Tax=Chlorokybus atmophyticus TaxID=3144 RepID=A2CI63_CHLAT|nr:hypothetical protein ChatCp091 [Chlorokybus atmophyticus]YP_001019177.1 hypothetical protein ChatCp114 [Chlorokybus atmophyticus]ABM87985.1 hypothetical protein [Chlorokybus atmophyticus]ABM87988.1 hypothetical protein [Chlorokybus atmophyticus]
MTRKSLEELNNERPSKRVLILSGQMDVPQLMDLITNEAEENYKRVEVIDLDEHFNNYKCYKEPQRSQIIKDDTQELLSQLFQWVYDSKNEPPLLTFRALKTIQMALKERIEAEFIKCDGTLPTWRDMSRKMNLGRLKNNKSITEDDLLELRKFFDILIDKPEEVTP